MREIPEKFLSPYDFNETEGRIYSLWKNSGFFNPDICVEKGVTKADAEAFSIVLPPPNVTGTLHTGHASMLAIEDIVVRYQRMNGKKTLWIPGTDHAAIATQSKVEKELYKKEKKNRHDLGRDEFLKRVEKFAQESHDTIVSQVAQMGASVDWSREAYTLDGEREFAVRTAFTRMYEAGLIYRGERIVNWDPKMQTTVSDDEIEYMEQTTPFYYLQYGPFVIGTARPETKFGDKYVVMHPEDPRYKKYEHGQELEIEWINGPITTTIIKDEMIDMDFGTGVMTITPWHSVADFELAEKYDLDKEQIIDLYGKLLPVAKEFEGQKIKVAREEIIKKLDEKGLVVKIDDEYTNKIATNSRGGGIIEPQILNQWFVNVNKEFTLPHSNIPGIESGSQTTLKNIMQHVVRDKHIEIIPDRFEKTYFQWIDNLRDWNISRQIWYGHQIPVWYKGSEIHVGVDAPDENGWTQDPDTLDTWFSSGLWTFSTLGWPEQTDDLNTYHPTNLLETGYDIIFFWVARMILMSGFLLGDIPFKTVYLHGLVRDEKGRKMSKSLGNIVDPLEYIEKYGADALRMALIVGVGPGADNSIGDAKVKAYRHFSNKLWNITRFVLSNIPETFIYEHKPEIKPVDQTYIDELHKLVKDVTRDIEEYRLHLAGEKLYHYAWHRFADVILEESKERLQEGTSGDTRSAVWTLVYILETITKMLHPFMPYITEEVWEHLPIANKKLLLVEKWPK